eukprot:3922433-Amphidinium_carterae.1
MVMSLRERPKLTQHEMDLPQRRVIFPAQIAQERPTMQRMPTRNLKTPTRTCVTLIKTVRKTPSTVDPQNSFRITKAEKTSRSMQVNEIQGATPETFKVDNEVGLDNKDECNEAELSAEVAIEDEDELKGHSAARCHKCIRKQQHTSNRDVTLLVPKSNQN